MPRANTLLTIGELRRQLADWEANWDETLGKFEDQAILTDRYDSEGHYLGVGEAKLLSAWELGLLIVQKEDI